MKKSLLFLLLGFCIRVSASNEGIFEYWYDQDPEQKIEGNISDGEINLTLDVSNLYEGIHLLTLRAGNSAGKWSSPVSSYFLRTPLKAGNAVMTNYEYWFDNDPTEKKTGTINEAGVVDLKLDLSSMILGIHTFSFRACDNNGYWTAPVTSFFVKVPAKVADNRIMSYQYWLDNNVENLVRKEANNDGFLFTDINVEDLTHGIHTLTLRGVDKAGKWSVPVTHYFVKPVSQLKGNKIAGYQYWLNNDYSNAVYENTVNPDSPLLLDTDLIVANADTVVTRDNIMVVDYLDGEKRIATRNSLHMRFVDLNHRWSEVETDSFALVIKGPRIDLSGVIINPEADYDKEGWDFQGVSMIGIDDNWAHGKYFSLSGSYASMVQSISCLPSGEYTLAVKAKVSAGNMVIRANGVESDRISSSGEWSDLYVKFTSDGSPFDIEALCGSDNDTKVDIDCWRLWTEVEEMVEAEILSIPSGNPLIAYAIEGGIYIQDCEGMEVRIFDLNGQEIVRTVPKSSKELIGISKGIYSVSSGGKSIKLIVP